MVSGLQDKPDSPAFSNTREYAWLILALTTFFIALTHVIGRGVRAEVPPVGLSFWRWVFGALVLLPFVLRRLHYSIPVIKANKKILIFLGIVMVSCTTLILIGLNFTTAINSSIINATQPIITVILAVLFLGSRLRPFQVIGVVLGITGVLVMVTRGDTDVLLGMSFNNGDLLILLGALGYSVYAINIRKIPGELTAAESLFVIIVAGSLFLLPFYIIESVVYKPVPLSTTAVTAIVVMSITVSVLGMLMWNRGNQIIGPSQAGMFMNLIPVFAIVLAVAFLDEDLYLFHITGMVMIGTGIILVLRERTD